MKNKLVAALIGVLVVGFAGLAQADFTGNKESKTFHQDNCPMVKAMKAENKVAFKTADEAIKAGYTLCKKCAAGTAVKSAFVGSKDGKKYHTAVCPIVASIKAENVVNFATENEAKKAGYAPCAKCLHAEKNAEVKAKVAEKKEEAKAKVADKKAEVKAKVDAKAKKAEEKVKKAKEEAAK